jgi:predicted dinucleotide-binding enzyme
MKIAIVGAGKIGSSLAEKWLQAGHAVTFGVRDAGSAKTTAALEKAGGAKVETIAAALAVGEVIVWAIPGTTVAELAQEHAAALSGKIMIDTTNNMRAADMSAIAVLTARVPSARVFRAFSTLGWENFAEPQLGGMPIDLFFCGPDEANARQAVERLITAVGLRPVYIGGLEQVPALDGVTRLWFALVSGQKHSRRLAFKMMEES